MLVLLVLLLVATPLASAATTHRTYEASLTHASGSPGQGGGFTGLGSCNPDVDTAADTIACLRLPASAAGRPFQVVGTDAAFGTQTYFIGGVDLDGNGQIACQGVGSEPCWFGQGGFDGTLPTGIAGKTFRVFPVTAHTTGFLCCPDSAATRGSIALTFA